MTRLEELFVQVFGEHPVMMGLGGGLVIAALNMVGALLVVAWRDPSERSLDGALGFAAGVMLSASFTSLILPGIEHGGLLPVVVGFLIGVLVLDRADAWVPHVHVLITGRIREEEEEPVPQPGSPRSGAGLASVLLFIVAITIHNLPEGLAVGVGFGAGDVGNAMALMMAIGLQNIPEGLAVAVATRNAGLGSLW